MLSTFERRGVIKEIFVWSGLKSPSELAEVTLPQFEAAMNVQVSVRGPLADGEWILRFTDLERPTKLEGFYEETTFHVHTHLDGQLWEIYTLEPTPHFRRTIYALIRSTPMLDYVLIPPSFMMNVMKTYDPNQELVAFRAQRDFFTVRVGNPHQIVTRDFADLRYRSANVPDDFVELVVKRPVGPLLLTSADITISYRYSREKSCTIRVELDGKLRQIRRGDKDIFREVRTKVLNSLITRSDKVADFIPISRVEEFRDSETGVEITSKNISQQPRPILVQLSKKLNQIDYLKLSGLLTQNYRQSGFLGTIVRQISESSCVVRTTDMSGGGDALIWIDSGQETIIINPLPTTSVRTIDRIYRTLLEKFDVDAILAL